MEVVEDRQIWLDCFEIVAKIHQEAEYLTYLKKENDIIDINTVYKQVSKVGKNITLAILDELGGNGVNVDCLEDCVLLL